MKEHFFYPSDLVNTKTTIPLRVGEERCVCIHHYSPPLIDRNRYFIKHTKLLLVGTRQMINILPTDFKLDFLGKQITPSSSGKDLGVVIDSQLTYDDHIDSIVSSCMGKTLTN